MEIFFIGDAPLIPYSSDIKPSSIFECYNYLKDKPEISIDIETTQKFGGIYNEEGLSPYLSKIVMFQIGDKHKQFIIDYRTVKLGIVSKLLSDNNIIKIGHNIKFEYLHILHNEKIRINNLYDTMIVEQILYNGYNLPMGLKALNERYLNIKVNKDTRLEFLTIGGKPFTETQIKYGAEDILYPVLIKEKQKSRIISENLNNCVRLEMLFIPVLGDIEYKGMHFNTEEWLDLYKENQKLAEEVKNDLDKIVTTGYYKTEFVDKQLDMFDPTTQKCIIQWTSSKQVIEFFNYIGICPKEVSKTTGKLSYTVNATVLKAELAKGAFSDHESYILKTYIKFKELEQKCTTFGKDFLKYINPVTKRLHSNYKQILNTGRISSSNPNLQNIPSEVEYRRCFSSPSDYVIVNADYSGQEQIILANKSKEPNLIKFYDSGESDMHSFIARELFDTISNTMPLPLVKTMFPAERQLAKAAGFAINNLSLYMVTYR